MTSIVALKKGLPPQADFLLPRLPAGLVHRSHSEQLPHERSPGGAAGDDEPPLLLRRAGSALPSPYGRHQRGSSLPTLLSRQVSAWALSSAAVHRR